MSRQTRASPLLPMGGLGKSSELKSRLLYVLMCLIIYRVGAYIPIPGVDPHILESIAAQNAGGVLGMFNMLSGGSLARMTIFALAIMPYITASIITQLLTVISKNLESLKKEGERGRQIINQYTRYLTVILAAFQGYGITLGLEAMSSSAGSVVMEPGMMFRATAVISLIGGTVFLMWLGEQMNKNGIGNGVSLIIFAGIVAGLPQALAGTLELGRTGALSTVLLLLLIVFAVGLVAFIIFMERAHRRIIVQYPKRQVGNKLYGGEANNIPLKLNTAGVIPAIFASSLLLFPLTIANFSTASDSPILDVLQRYLAHGRPLYIITYGALIVFFSFFYTSIVFNPTETADQLKKHGGFVPGRRPGKPTAEFLDYVLTRLTVIGAAYIALVCIIPEMLISNYSVPFYLGGTSLLIVVNVVMDTMMQIQTHLYAHQYEGLMKKAHLRGRR